MKNGFLRIKTKAMRQIFQLSTWVGLLLIGIVTTGGLLWASSHQSMQTSLQLHVLSQLSMHTQRIAKAYLYSIQGQNSAFEQLDESKTAFAQGLHLLLEGGDDESGHHYFPPSASDAAEFQQLQHIWRETDQSVVAILAKKKELVGLHNTKERIDVLLPTVFTLRKKIILSKNKLWQQERADITTSLLLETLALYVSLSSKEDNTKNEDAMLGQFNNNIREYSRLVNSLLTKEQGETVHISDNDQAELQQSIQLLEEYSKLLTGFVETYPILMKAKHVEASISFQTEALKDGLTEFIDKKESLLAARTWAFWPIQIAIIFTILCALGIVRERLRISYQQAEQAELQRIEAEQQRRIAEEQEERLRQFHEQNKRVLLAFTQELERLSEGDLTVHLKESDDVIGAIATMMNQSVDSIRGLVRKIIEMAELVSVTTGALGGHTAALVDISRRQSGAIRETGSDIQEIATQMSQISESASAAADVAKDSVIAAERGSKAVGDSVQGMYDIRDHIKETSQRIKRLGESSQEIGEVTDLITDIAEQTNVLSMNAFIQAASAGEAGKGFTVVAEEIQRLAERSNDATKQISALIKMIQVDTHDAIAAMERSTAGVVEGSKLADAAGEALSDIKQVSNQMADLIRHFSSSTQSQAVLTRRVAVAIQNMLELNVRIEEGRERLGENYQQLNGVAQQLKNSVSPFRISS